MNSARAESRMLVGFALGASIALAATENAAAQVVGQATSTTTTATSTPPSAPNAAPPLSAQTGMTLPGATPDPAADADDHQRVVRHFGIGYMGRRAMAIDIGANGPVTVDAPVIGARYWLDSLIGIDAGIGLLLSTGSNTANNATTDAQGYTVFILHGGVPLALAGSKHFSFQVVPELNLGVASSQRSGTMDDLTGIHFDIGARAGAEIQFGFIGIPELSLQAGIGLGLSYDRVKASPVGMPENIQSRTTFGTSVGDNPWNIFTGNIAALYYFD